MLVRSFLGASPVSFRNALGVSPKSRQYARADVFKSFHRVSAGFFVGFVAPPLLVYSIIGFPPRFSYCSSAASRFSRIDARDAITSS